MTNNTEPKQETPQTPVPDKRVPIGPLDCASLGSQFGRLTIEHRSGSIAHCRCRCGNHIDVPFRRILSGNTRSCGCLLRESRSANGKGNRRHGMKKTPTYKSWGSMKQRCLNSRSVGYPRYGGRGITVCDRWMIFDNFLADMGVKPDGLTLERIDNNGNYEPSNCKWAIRKEQTRNRRTTVYIFLDGETRILGEVCKEKGVCTQLIHGRLYSGWSVNEELFKPSMRPGYRQTMVKNLGQKRMVV